MRPLVMFYFSVLGETNGFEKRIQIWSASLSDTLIPATATVRLSHGCLHTIPCVDSGI